MNFLNYIVLEYSVSQDAFHRHTVKEMLTKNIMACSEKQARDFLAIGIFPDHDQCDHFYDRISGLITGDTTPAEIIGVLTVERLLNNEQAF